VVKAVVVVVRGRAMPRKRKTNSEQKIFRKRFLLMARIKEIG